MFSREFNYLSLFRSVDPQHIAGSNLPVVLSTHPASVLYLSLPYPVRTVEPVTSGLHRAQPRGSARYSYLRESCIISTNEKWQHTCVLVRCMQLPRTCTYAKYSTLSQISDALDASAHARSGIPWKRPDRAAHSPSWPPALPLAGPAPRISRIPPVLSSSSWPPLKSRSAASRLSACSRTRRNSHYGPPRWETPPSSASPTAVGLGPLLPAPTATGPRRACRWCRRIRCTRPRPAARPRRRRRAAASASSPPARAAEDGRLDEAEDAQRQPHPARPLGLELQLQSLAPVVSLRGSPGDVARRCTSCKAARPALVAA